MGRRRSWLRTLPPGGSAFKLGDGIQVGHFLLAEIFAVKIVAVELIKLGEHVDLIGHQHGGVRHALA